MISPRLRKAWQFHLEWGGYCTPPGRAACALQAARAELLLHEAVERELAKVEWVYDNEPYDGGDAYTAEEVAAKFESGEWEGPLGCVVTVGEEDQDDGYASCWGIVLIQDDPYRRVMEAELALELGEELRDCLAPGENIDPIQKGAPCPS